MCLTYFFDPFPTLSDVHVCTSLCTLPVGTLLQQKKELELHCDLKRGDRLLFFSTLGWMMWNWAAAALSVKGAALVAFDGSPGHPDLATLWRVSAREGVTHLGASPK